MLTKLLIRIFVKDRENVNDEDVRNRYGFLAGTIGIISNLVLFIVKFAVGIITSSVAVTADAFNNFTDMASSIITMIGFKMAIMPADEKHPFGHGRIEYISALIVSFLVMFVGAQFIKTSVERIMNPVPVEFQIIPFLLLAISITVKLWLGMFNSHIGDKIDSSAIKAVAVDAYGDVVTSGCVALSFFATRFTDIPIDGFVGVAVSIAILYAGFSLVKETISPILGEAPDPDLVDKIVSYIMNYDMVKGVHDLMIHNYGVGKCLASVHVEVPAEMNIMKIHEIIDDMERDISKRMNIELVIHMDPICTQSKEVDDAKAELLEILSRREEIKSMHDFRVVGEGEKKNLVFEVVVDPEFESGEKGEEIKVWIEREVRAKHSGYNCVIAFDREYVSAYNMNE